MTRKTKVLLLGAFCLVLALITTLALTFSPKGTEGAKELTIVISADEKNEEFTINTDREFLGEALLDEELVEGEDGEFGLFITSANGRKADDTKQEWWCITKDGEMLETGADTTPILDGESYELTLTIGW